MCKRQKVPGLTVASTNVILRFFRTLRCTVPATGSPSRYNGLDSMDAAWLSSVIDNPRQESSRTVVWTVRRTTCDTEIGTAGFCKFAGMRSKMTQLTVDRRTSAEKVTANWARSSGVPMLPPAETLVFLSFRVPQYLKAVKMDNLPVELAAAVFRQLDLQDCIAVSHVCRRWRTTAVGDPMLWTRVSSEDMSLDGLETLLSRSRGAPLWISTGTFTPGEEHRVAAILVHNMARIRHMIFQSRRQRYTEDVQKALCTAAPVIETFTMYSLDEDDMSLPELLFGGLAPRLHVLKLHSVHIPLRCAALANVAFLSLRVFETPPPIPFCLSDVLPGVTGLQLTHLSDGRAHVSLKPGHFIGLLEMTGQYEPDTDFCEQLLAIDFANALMIKATTTNLETLDLVLTSMPDVTTISLGLLEPSLAERWEERWDDKECVPVDVSFNAPSRLRRFPLVYWPDVRDRLADPTRLATVVSFNVAHHLLQFAPPCLPRMKYLYIEFPDEDVLMNYDHLSLWLELERAPQLEALTLSGDWQTGFALGHRPLTKPRVLSAVRLAACIKTRSLTLKELKLCLEMEEAPEVVRSLLESTVTSFFRLPLGRGLFHGEQIPYLPMIQAMTQ
ncbi:hypothetical protein AURDEDRAFT_150822 [Auricularia subglabra TFB-10046 SS5]|nr:hypothetical protein AURDEDRAFT_150822 [Auricularia subglabra TFB-10046 SS5]